MKIYLSRYLEQIAQERNGVRRRPLDQPLCLA